MTETTHRKLVYSGLPPAQKEHEWKIFRNEFGGILVRILETNKNPIVLDMDWGISENYMEIGSGKFDALWARFTVTEVIKQPYTSNFEMGILKVPKDFKYSRPSLAKRVQYAIKYILKG